MTDQTTVDATEELGQAKHLPRGSLIRRYVVLQQVGSGGMGVVYAAYDPDLDRKIALKLLRPTDAQPASDHHKQRLLREAQAIAKLSHPNVVAVHDVGEFEGQVFLAMEFLGGGTLRSWLAARPRPWREIVAMFVQVGRALAAAHEASLVHRDFKPDNVILDKEGRPRVVDFGLAQVGAQPPEREPVEPVHPTGQVDARLTRTGALVGTPAYMAPEQFMGGVIDARTDQFSFSVALFEALYGERPFEGEGLVALAASVVGGKRKTITGKARVAPAWVRALVLRGLASEPDARWPSMKALADKLADDPAVRRVRRLWIGAAVGAVLLTAAAGAAVAQKRRRDLEARIAGHIQAAASISSALRQKQAVVTDKSRLAFQAFDARRLEQGEKLWAETLALAPQIDALEDQELQALSMALALDDARARTRTLMADALARAAARAERNRRAQRHDELLKRLSSYDDGSRQAVRGAPARLTVTTDPPATITLGHWVTQPDKTRKLVALRDLGKTPIQAASVPGGSLQLTIQAPDRPPVQFPFRAGPGESLSFSLDIPSSPEGYVYVPPGKFLFGDADEALRTGFLTTVPMHEAQTGSYVIAIHETTYAQWIAFLETLSPAERRRQGPRLAAAGFNGSVELTELPGTWQLSLLPRDRLYRATLGEPLRYAGREKLAEVDWARLPVTGISLEQIERYLRWLRESKRLPGARLCTDLEWERAARGADDRVFSHGDRLAPSDANYDETYGRRSAAYGLNPVGSHPVSVSPFFVHDLVGNAYEFVTSSLEDPSDPVLRGGAFSYTQVTARLTNREPVPRTFRDVALGFRVCADVASAQTTAEVAP
jgi:formylglycine-generating enzyme required for sulfatase activity